MTRKLLLPFWIMVLILLPCRALPGQSTDIVEIRLHSDPEQAVIRPLESIVIQVLAFTEVENPDGETRKVRVQGGGARFSIEGRQMGWISKPFRYQGEEEIPFYESPGAGLGSILLGRASSEFLLQDSVLFTASERTGTVRIRAELKGRSATMEIRVAADAPARKKVETVMFKPPRLTGDPYRRLVEHYAPLVAQETWFWPKADFLARFDYDGNWKGLNNWDSLETGSSQAYVYYAVMETSTHWFLIYNFFHPRDYSDKCVAGTCHENDNEGMILTVRKDGSKWGNVQVMETLAHNNIYSYRSDKSVRNGVHNIDDSLEFYQGSHPVVFIESGGHGVYGSRGGHSRYRLSGDRFTVGTGVTYTYKNKAERPVGPDDRLVGYQLLPIWDHWWNKAQKDAWAKGSMFDDYFRYAPRGNRPTTPYQEIAGAFRGEKFGRNKAKPFWGWHDRKTSKKEILSTGQWGLDPAYAVSLNLRIPEPFSLDYVFNPYLGVGRKPASKTSTPKPPVRSSMQRQAAPARTKVRPISLKTLVESPVSSSKGRIRIESEVNDFLVVRIRGQKVTAETRGGRSPRFSSVILSHPVPLSRELTQLNIRKITGRGDVELLERPWKGNDFTIVFRIRDPEAGAGMYQVQIDWEK